MTREDKKLSAAKRAYRDASQEGNWNEEAKWANVIGDILKNRGEYVEALKWLRIDYEVSVKHLPEKHLVTTCQSLGEVYLRLEYFRDALIYQKKHLELAKDSNDLIEQQRASTQLGRTYHEMFLKSNDDHYSVRNAKKYFKIAMKLAHTLKKNPPSNESSFLDEFIDAHNNIGMLEMDLDNLEEAEKVLTKGLEICDEEEVVEDNDVRTRLHHNLGNVYMELRIWDEAQEHIEKDIIICKKIGHCQGEAKGYINLGELHYRVQKYEEAILCYKKALDLAKSMEDEDALASQIEKNIQTVNEAAEVVDELKKEEQHLKKLSRNMVIARGTSSERRCILRQNASLDRLIEKSSMISAWLKHLEFAKQKKKIAAELSDKEKLGDSFLFIGDSYQKLRNFDKALKWYGKAWDAYKSIGNLEGQALVKINIGDALDSNGNWTGALVAFEDGYKIAVEANLPSVQVSALENMHYSHMIRFDNIEHARRLQCLIDNLKQSKGGVLDVNNKSDDRCSETDSEGDDCLSTNKSNANSSTLKSLPLHCRSKPVVDVCPMNDDDVPLVSILRSIEPSTPFKRPDFHNNVPKSPIQTSLERLSKSNYDWQPCGHKRVRLVVSDDEDEMIGETENFKQKIHEHLVEGIATSSNCGTDACATQPRRIDEFLDVPAVSTSCPLSSCNPVNLEENRCSQKSDFSNVSAQYPNIFKSASTGEIHHHSNARASFDSTENLLQRHSDPGVKFSTPSDEFYHTVTFKIDNELIPMEISSSVIGGELNIGCLKVEVACLYYLQLNLKKKRQGLLPIIQLMKCGGTVLESLKDFKTLKDQVGDGWIEVFVDGWIQKPLMKLYIDCCEDLSMIPNLMLLKKLYNLEVSEDEVIASDCELQDISIAPLLNALNAHMSISMIDLSHNFLGNRTLEKLNQVFTSSCQKYGGLSLDLHCNRFGPSALFQICECPVLFARLEALNISGNRLTDACGSYLATILKNCKALYSLNVERCSLTSRTIQMIADSLDPGCSLAHLSFGYNHPISVNAAINLLAKLSTLERLSELNLNGLRLGKLVIDSLCQYLKSSRLSALMLGETGVGTDGALQLTESVVYSAQQSLEKLNLSYCGLTSLYLVKLNSDFPLACTITDLNLEGNSIKQEGAGAVASMLKNPECCMKVLVLNNCALGLDGVIQVMRALAGNTSMEELHVVENSSESPCGVNTNELEVADSEDEQVITHSCISNQEHEFIERLSSAIRNAKSLTLLDLSKNGFNGEIAETLYTAWSSNPRYGRACQKHIQGDLLHLSIQSMECCKPRPCCRRD